MSIEGINGKNIEAEIHSIAKSGNAGSRSGRIEILEKISNLGKEILDAMNSKDENLVEMEGSYESLAKEMEDLQNEIDGAEQRVENANSTVEDINKKIAELEAKAENGEELTESEQSDLEYYYQLRDTNINGVNTESGKISDLSGQLSGKSSTLEKYDTVLSDIIETMDDFAEAGDEVRQAAHDFGRPKMAENLENKSGSGNALKRNESMWGKGWIMGIGGAAVANAISPFGGLAAIGSGVWLGSIGSGAMAVGTSALGAFGGTLLGDLTKNKTEKYIERMGYRGLGDGANGVNMTYHDDVAGGYQAEYDVIQYGIGGKLRDLTAKTWSYGKTINTGSNDMKHRAENISEKHKVKPEENIDENTQ